MITEMPATFATLAAGRTTEWRAQLMVRETAMLSRQDRAQVDSHTRRHGTQVGVQEFADET